jgi:mannose-6-phosphate isomerase
LIVSSSSSASWHKSERSFLEKVWGSPHLSPWFADTAALTGEVWFAPVGGILVKFLFTTAKLSVQVHPGGAAGKTEMWHVLRADPGAAIALGFREPQPPEAVRAACLSGAVQQMLEWFPVTPGDTYFVPAGTVHALGAGIAVCEIQQNNDVTYRLYDYGRPRELHLEQALAVSELTRHPGKCEFPVSCEYFATSRFVIEAGRTAVLPGRGHSQVVFLAGYGLAGGQAYGPGEVWSGNIGLEIAAREETLILRASPPAS